MSENILTLIFEECAMDYDKQLASATSAWFEKVLSDPKKMSSWLQKQYFGEVTAASRIIAMRDRFSQPRTIAYRVLTVIAKQEENHALWVHNLLAARGIEVITTTKQTPYWDQTLTGVTSLETAAGVASHAENMRLARIYRIVEDKRTPSDIQGVFRKILPQERFHERAFAKIAGPLAMAETQGNHVLGMRVLGLVN